MGLFLILILVLLEWSNPSHKCTLLSQHFGHCSCRNNLSRFLQMLPFWVQQDMLSGNCLTYFTANECSGTSTITYAIHLDIFQGIIFEWKMTHLTGKLNTELTFQMKFMNWAFCWFQEFLMNDHKDSEGWLIPLNYSYTVGSVQAFRWFHDKMDY